MHDCLTMKDRLLDLIFDEIAFADRARLTAEIEGCQDCRDLYRSMAETLTVFDQAVEAGMPEESYWPEYNERLRVRLTQEKQLSLWRRSLDRLMSFNPLPSLPLSVRVGLALLIMMAALWIALPRGEDRAITPSPTVAEEAPQENPVQENITLDEMDAQKSRNDELKGHQAAPVKPNRKSVHIAAKPKREVTAEPATDTVAAKPRRVDANSFLREETARHIEVAQMLLRSFRNVRVPEDTKAFDISYEKRLSRELLSRNMLLRRSAENKQSRKVEQLLNSIEPVLLDIANLPDAPSKEDVGSIKDLIERQAIIAELQFYSARASSRID